MPLKNNEISFWIWLELEIFSNLNIDNRWSIFDNKFVPESNFLKNSGTKYIQVHRYKYKDMYIFYHRMVGVIGLVDTETCSNKCSLRRSSLSNSFWQTLQVKLETDWKGSIWMFSVLVFLEEDSFSSKIETNTLRKSLSVIFWKDLKRK